MYAEWGDDNDADMREDESGVGPEQFHISGSPAEEPEEEIVLASRAATPSEMRLRSLERTPVRTENRDQL